MLTLWKRIVFVLKKPFTTERVKKLTKVAQVALVKGEAGIDQHYIHGPEAEAVAKLAGAAAGLVRELNGYDDAILRVGSLLLVKVTADGKSRLAVETMSARVRRILDENPRLLEDPNALFQELQKLNCPVRELPPPST